LLGAGHGLEVPFVFGQFRSEPAQLGHSVFDEANGPSRQRLSNEMMSYWAEFAWRGAPGRGRRGELPEWRPWDEAGHVPGRFLVFDSVAGGGVRMARGKITSDDVLAELVASTDLAAAEKCLVLRRLRPQLPSGLDLRARRALDVRSRLCREAAEQTL
jgi:para-nitrobenzyl esterase